MSIKPLMIAAIVGMLATGCASITVVRPLDPASAAVRMPASTVMVSYTNTCQTNLDWQSTIQHKLEPELNKQLALRGFTLSQNASNADFLMIINLSDFKIGEALWVGEYYNILRREEVITAITCNINYVGPNGVVFGTVKEVIGNDPTSYITAGVDESGRRVLAEYHGYNIDIPRACKDIANFTSKALKNAK
jgi:hypothetical protein